jgi:hypothetical protein
MGTTINYLIIIIAAFIEFLTIKAWFICKSFTDLFHLSSINVILQIEDAVHSEKGTSLTLTRLFTNKVINTFFDFLRIYLQFWDIRFGASWFSPIGYFGIFSGFYYIASYKKKRWYHWGMIIIILLLPLIEMVKEPNISIILKSAYLWIPFILFSLYGTYQFLTHGSKKKRFFVIFILLLVSIWWTVLLPFTMPRYCVK